MSLADLFYTLVYGPAGGVHRGFVHAPARTWYPSARRAGALQPH